MIGFSFGASAVLATNGSEIWSPLRTSSFYRNTTWSSQYIRCRGTNQNQLLSYRLPSTQNHLVQEQYYLPANIYVNDDEVTSELVIGQPKPSLQITYTCVARNLYNDELKTSTKIGKVYLEMQE